uniref:Retrotransposon protein, putative, unclassified n=1 Tax=Oryza sativa subsp. japonica TaxID=39947 RepID=Q7G3D9_ORYSJ|nr:retrotransposon protein, putative, unclassified [Oryza sativa Japonica Group]
MDASHRRRPIVKSIDGLAHALGKIWCPIKGVSCKDLGENHFLFTFHQASGKRRALEDGPWMFNKDLVVMIDLDETKLIEDMIFAFVPIWVRAMKLPLGLMTKETGMAIGREVGEFMTMDLEEDGSAVGQFLRIKIRIDIRKPLMRGVTLFVGADERPLWCPLVYEFLPDFCYICGIVGHTEKLCEKKLAEGEAPLFNKSLRFIPERKIWEGGSSDKTSGSRFQVQRKSGASSCKGSDAPSWQKEITDGSKGKEKGTQGEDEVTSPLKKGFPAERSDRPKKSLFQSKKGAAVEATKKGEAGKQVDSAMQAMHIDSVPDEGLVDGGASGVVMKKTFKRIPREERGAKNGHPKLTKPEKGGPEEGVGGKRRRSAGGGDEGEKPTKKAGLAIQPCLYGDAHSETKHRTWTTMRGLIDNPTTPWLMAGDFNEILFSHEKQCGRMKAQSAMDEFRHALTDCGLDDLGFEGDAFTWRNHSHSQEGYIREWLDRAVANPEWRAMFPAARVINGDPRHSDHRPVIIELEGKNKGVRGRNGHNDFRFEAAWLEEEKFKEVVKEAWDVSAGLQGLLVHASLAGVAAGLSSWSSNVLGDLEKRLKKVKKELETCRRQPISRDQVVREEVLRYRLEKLEQQNLLDVVDRKVSGAMNESLRAEFTREEVKEALDAIGDLKAPGPDGMPAGFYKACWDVVGEKVTVEVLEVLRGGAIPEGWNDTTIVLIPKVLANRLKKILPDVISPAQSAFVPGRLISDNILIAYEMTHYMRNKRSGQVGYAAFKLDMSKAYDRVEWSFLHDMMLKLGFHTDWVNLIMKCVSTVTYRIRVNGELSESFSPERGLRQGDPLSPYLFLLCAEGFSALLSKTEEEGRLHGIRICQGAPSVSHLLFADDSLILCRANGGEAQQLQTILQIYEECSGQVINKDKSAVMFSPNTSSLEKGAVMAALNMQRETTNEKYLGLPVFVGRSRTKIFSYLKERIWQRIQGWKEKLLSRAGKEILIKAVAQVIPTFAMGCFELTKDLCDQISKMIAKYWWSNQEKDNKMHWLSWNKLTLPKNMGGLGFRDIYIFNLAMLAKQGWRLIQDPDSLCSRVLRAKYFPLGDCFRPKQTSNVSYTWRSIQKGLRVLQNGMIWRVGDGSKINIWADPWIPRGWSRKPMTPRGANLVTKVEELIDPYTGTWDEDLLSQTFWEEDVAAIKSIPVHVEMEDVLAWHFDARGCFTVKSAYKVQREMERRASRNGCPGVSNWESGDDDFWKKLWKLGVPGKIKHFLWRMCHNTLALRANLHHRGMDVDTRCVMCGRYNEDAGHLFFKCKPVKKVWQALNLEELRSMLEQQTSGKNVLQSIYCRPENERTSAIVCLWQWWKERNEEKSPRTGECAVWRRPPLNFVKINTDGAYSSNMKQGGWGFVIRDQTGAVLQAGAGPAAYLQDAFHAEVVACAAAIKTASERGMSRIELETDSMMLRYSPRSCNKVAHELAAYGCNLQTVSSWAGCPPGLERLVSSDSAGLDQKIVEGDS